MAIIGTITICTLKEPAVCEDMGEGRTYNVCGGDPSKDEVGHCPYARDYILVEED